MTIAECPEYIKLEIKPETLSPGEKGEILVTFDSNFDYLYGTYTDNVMISMKMDKQEIKGSIKIIATIVEDFSKLTEEELAVAPVIYFPERAVNFGEIEAKEIKRIEIEFENRGRSELIIRNIEMNNMAYILNGFDEVVESGGKGKIVIETNPAYISAALDTRVTVIANAPKSSRNILRVYGTKKIQKSEFEKNKNIQSKFKNIKVYEARDIIKDLKKSDKLVILDVRTPKEYENGCLFGAFNFNVEDNNFKKEIQLLDRSKMYLVYCKSGIRSKDAVSVMNELGFKNILHMFEGMDGWQKNRLEVSDPGK